MAGRKPKPPGEVKSDQLRIPLTESQKAAIQEAAKRAGSEMTAWARTILVKAAGKPPKAD